MKKYVIGIILITLILLSGCESTSDIYIEPTVPLYRSPEESFLTKEDDSLFFKEFGQNTSWSFEQEDKGLFLRGIPEPGLHVLMNKRVDLSDFTMEFSCVDMGGDASYGDNYLAVSLFKQPSYIGSTSEGLFFVFYPFEDGLDEPYTLIKAYSHPDKKEVGSLKIPGGMKQKHFIFNVKVELGGIRYSVNGFEEKISFTQFSREVFSDTTAWWFAGVGGYSELLFSFVFHRIGDYIFYN